jgi:hypothetical protein
MGGTVRSTAANLEGYRRSFTSGMHVHVTFTDAA